MFSYESAGQILTLTLTVSTYPTLAERLALFDTVRVDWRVPLGTMLIIDVRSLPAPDFSEAAAIERLHLLINLLGPKLGPACAIVRGAHGADSHMFQTAGRGLGLRVALFCDEHTARQWLKRQRLALTSYGPVSSETKGRDHGPWTLTAPWTHRTRPPVLGKPQTVFHKRPPPYSGVYGRG